MSTRYFKITGAGTPTPWFPRLMRSATGRYIDHLERSVWLYTSCVPIDQSEIVQFRADGHGLPVDFTLGSFGIPIISDRFSQILQGCCAQEFELLRTSLKPIGSWWILNVLHSIPCLDLSRSVVAPGRPTATGTIAGVVKMVLDTSEIGNARIFRVAQHPQAVIISEEIVLAINAAGLTGYRLIGV